MAWHGQAFWFDFRPGAFGFQSHTDFSSLPSVALLIKEAYEGFSILRWSRVDVTQQAIQRKGAGPDQIGRILDGLWWYTIHLSHYLNTKASELPSDLAGWSLPHRSF
jgi:hypothetical protein